MGSAAEAGAANESLHSFDWAQPTVQALRDSYPCSLCSSSAILSHLVGADARPAGRPSLPQASWACRRPPCSSLRHPLMPALLRQSRPRWRCLRCPPWQSRRAFRRPQTAPRQPHPMAQPPRFPRWRKPPNCRPLERLWRPPQRGTTTRLLQARPQRLQPRWASFRRCRQRWLPLSVAAARTRPCSTCWRGSAPSPACLASFARQARPGTANREA